MWDFRNSLAASMVDILAKVMSEALPEELMDTLQHVQIASLEEKKASCTGSSSNSSSCGGR